MGPAGSEAERRWRNAVSRLGRWRVTTDGVGAIGGVPRTLLLETSGNSLFPTRSLLYLLSRVRHRCCRFNTGNPVRRRILPSMSSLAPISHSRTRGVAYTPLLDDSAHRGQGIAHRRSAGAAGPSAGPPSRHRRTPPAPSPQGVVHTLAMRHGTPRTIALPPEQRCLRQGTSYYSDLDQAACREPRAAPSRAASSSRADDPPIHQRHAPPPCADSAGRQALLR
jgi:hypothetical protein